MKPALESALKLFSLVWRKLREPTHAAVMDSTRPVPRTTTSKSPSPIAIRCFRLCRGDSSPPLELDKSKQDRISQQNYVTFDLVKFSKWILFSSCSQPLPPSSFHLLPPPHSQWAIPWTRNLLRKRLSRLTKRSRPIPSPRSTQKSRPQPLRKRSRLRSTKYPLHPKRFLRRQSPSVGLLFVLFAFN